LAVLEDFAFRHHFVETGDADIHPFTLVEEIPYPFRELNVFDPRCIHASFPTAETILFFQWLGLINFARGSRFLQQKPSHNVGQSRGHPRGFQALANAGRWRQIKPVRALFVKNVGTSLFKQR
jgi:hypothetical protein